MNLWQDGVRRKLRTDGACFCKFGSEVFSHIYYICISVARYHELLSIW